MSYIYQRCGFDKAFIAAKIVCVYTAFLSFLLLIATAVPASSHFLSTAQMSHGSVLSSSNQPARAKQSFKQTLNSCSALCQAVIRRSAEQSKKTRRKRLFFYPVLEKTQALYLRLFSFDGHPRYDMYRSSSWTPPDLILSSGQAQTSR